LFVIKRKSISAHTFTDFSWKNNKKEDQAFLLPLELASGSQEVWPTCSLLEI
jgi:hypothetical protein